MIKKLSTTVIFIFIVVQAFSVTIWKDNNVYSSEGNVNTGDIIIVNITDLSNLKFNLNLENTLSANIASNPDITITGFLPKVASNKAYTNKESTSFDGNSKIDLSIATRVTDILQNKFATITGSRTYVFNGVANKIIVTGIVDPALVNSRTINSNYVSDFRIQIIGQKEGLTIRKGQIPEGESASSEFTEEEKQKIITDYLEKIIREMVR